MRKQMLSPWSRTAVAVSLALAAGAAGAVPGYVTSVGDAIPVTDGFGNCWRVGDWTPGMAAAPCHAVARAQAAPVPVVRAEPPAPAPAPIAAPAAPPVLQRITLSTDVLFEFNKAQLRPGAHEKLDELAQTMQGAEVDRIVAIGHADRIASEQYNQELSQRRADAVKEYLVQKGVDPQRVQADGRGESEPVAQCAKMGPERASNQKLVSCLQPDRRVEIEVLGHRQVAGDAPASGGASSGGATSGSSSPGTTR
ncbi:MAG TPA: OmpA family protein [Burkholderiales bacterium]|nr:OmpA family protein [Burkholderiales bacterium]